MEQPTASMRIKSFFSSSVEQAIQEARQELGPDAMLITSRRSAPESRSLGAYEVVFGLQGAATRSATPPSSRPRAAQHLAAQSSADLSSELQNLRAQLEEIKSTLQGPRSPEQATPDAEELFAQLLSLDLSRNVARDVVSAAARLRDQLSAEQPSAALPLQAYATELLTRRLRFAPPFHPETTAETTAETAQERGKLIVFVGPAGAGKTTTLVKIAIREGLANRRSVRILSVDPYRVAAHEKLRSFAGIIGVGFSAVNSVQEFAEAVEESRNKSVVLVDTPGYSPSEIDHAKEIAGCLERIPNKQVHLVLPASMQRDSLTRCIRDYADFEPDYLLFTKLDETDSRGAILSTALETDRALSFFASGQNIPEDIEPASAAVLLASMFRREAAEAVSAA
jgi:flagellar biosynthesis protein FlhF